MFWLTTVHPLVMIVFCHPTTSIRILFYKKLKNVSCEYDRLNGWNYQVNFASCVVHQTRSLDVLIRYFIYNMVL